MKLDDLEYFLKETKGIIVIPMDIYERIVPLPNKDYLELVKKIRGEKDD